MVEESEERSAVCGNEQKATEPSEERATTETEGTVRPSIAVKFIRHAESANNS